MASRLMRNCLFNIINRCADRVELRLGLALGLFERDGAGCISIIISRRRAGKRGISLVDDGSSKMLGEHQGLCVDLDEVRVRSQLDVLHAAGDIGSPFAAVTGYQRQLGSDSRGVTYLGESLAG
jgi:hypothetical protein